MLTFSMENSNIYQEILFDDGWKRSRNT